MTRMNSYVVLSGGLGNQLFQYAAGLSFAGEGDLKLELSLATMRNGYKGESPLQRINTPNSVEFISGRGPSKINRLVFLYLFRLSSTKNSIESRRLWRGLVTIVSSIYLSYNYKEKVRVNFSLDKSSNAPVVSRRSTVYIGYFQRHEYSERYREKIDSKIMPLKESASLRELIKLNEGKKILAVHVRLGDYLLEDKFGIPTKDYYRNAIAFQFKHLNFDAIWVFSEEPENAEKLIPREYLGITNFIADIDNDEIYSMIAMTKAHGYVIANSTFSFWGATLSDSKSPLVVAPDPWFRSLDAPRGLLPKHWHKIAAHS